MSPPLDNLELLETCQISPPAGLAADFSCLPATFFDLVFTCFHPVQRLFFYEFRHSARHFLTGELPNLKRSLSLALSRFYPLAGCLMDAGGSRKPEIRHTESDSVALLVAISGDDFFDLSGNHARDISRLHPLLPSLFRREDAEAVLAIQVTVFPQAGVVIGTTMHHAVADGSTFTNFMKTWSSFCRSSDTAAISIPPPFFDRSKIHDKKGLEAIFMNDLMALKDDKSFAAWDLAGCMDVVLATFVFSRRRLAMLGSKTAAKCSPYSLACGYAWSCLVKARGETSKKLEHFGFVTGCRGRLDPPVPASYFGNCLGICCVEAKRSDLIGSGGTTAAAEAIWKVIEGLEDGAAFAGAEKWIRNVFGYAAKRAVTVAGSPKLGIYGVDFGFGSPRKVEIVSIERTGALALAESREEAGGIEIGVALPRREMEAFVSYFLDGWENLLR